MRPGICGIIIILSLFLHLGFLPFKKPSRIYTNKSIGWRMEIPPKWSIEDNNSHENKWENDTLFIVDSIKEGERKGIPFTLLQFSKNKKNRFDAIVEKPSPNQKSIEEKTAKMAEMMVRALNQRGAESEVSQEKKKIAEVEFELLTIRLLNDSGDTDLTQKIFIALLKNGYVLTVSLSSTKEKLALELENAFLSSNFE